MPSRRGFIVVGARLDQAKPERLHAIVSRWLEETTEEHKSSTKGFALSPAFDVDKGIEFHVNLVEDRLVSRMEAATTVTLVNGVTIGGTQYNVQLPGESAILAEISWEEIVQVARSANASSFSFEFKSPTVFRTGARSLPVPLPGNVFGHLRRIWRTFAPSGLSIDVDIKELNLAIQDIHIDSQEVTLGLGQSSNPMRAVGFTGEVLFRSIETSRRQRDDLATLTLLANFCGVGSGTTYGLGETVAAPVP